MPSPLRLDLVHTSPVVTTALRDELGTGEHPVTVASAVHSWTDFQREWDFAGEVVVLDALLDDHVPLALKVRALRRLGPRAIVLGPGRHSPLARRAAAEGARAWVEPTHTLAETGDLIREIALFHAPAPARLEPAAPPAAALTDRELQVLCLYAGPRGHSPAHLGQVLGLRTATVRSHLERGRSRYRAAGRPTHNRAALRQALIDDGWLVPPTVWTAAARL
ncbi:MAG: hypothetical protein ACTMHL_12690 [Janibacter sp.]